MTEPTDGLGRTTLSGLKWTYLATGVSIVLQVGYTVVMGRLIAPEAYGLVAAAQVVLRFAQYVAELGLGPALVQRKDLNERHQRAAFTSSVLLGVALTALCFLAAPLGAAVFDDPDVVPVLQVMSLSLLLGGIGLVPLSLLRRRMAFRQIATMEVSTYAVGYLGVGLTTALLGADIWSLVAAVLCQQLLAAVVTLVMARPPLRPLLAFRELRSLYTFGGMVSVISILEFAAHAAPTLVVSRRAGAAALGQYNRAWLLIELPLYHLSTSFSKVLFPALSRIQEERDRIRGIYLFAIRAAGSVMVPIAAGVAVAAPELVAVLLGPQWGPAADVLPVLAIAGALSAVSHFGGIVAEALGDLRRKLALQATYVVVLLAGLLLNRSAWLVGFGIAVAVAELLRSVLYARLMASALAIPWRQHAAAWSSILVAALAVSAAIAAWSIPARAWSLPAALILAGQIGVGAVVLLLLVRSGPLRAVRDELLVRLASAGLLLDSTRIGGIAVRALGQSSSRERA